jgi:hypothetical protein
MKIKLQLLIFLFPSLIFGQGIKNVNVNSVLQEQTKTNIVKVLYNPVLDTILPYSAQQGDTVVFTITAHNTHFTQGIIDVKISNPNNIFYHYPNSTTVVNDTTLLSTFIFYYTLSPGAYDLCIESVAEGLMCMNNAISLTTGAYPPSITITPDSATQEDVVHLTITGTNTHFMQYTGVVISDAYRSMYPDSFSIVNDTLIHADFSFDYNDPARVYNVKIYASGIYAYYYLPDGFTLIAGPHPPALSSISPSSASQGDTVTIHIAGHNTHFLSGIGTLKIGAYNALYHTTINDSTVNAFFVFTYNMYTSTHYTLTLSNSTDGNLTLANAFALNPGLNPPSLKKIVPTYAQRGDTVTISLFGINTTFFQVTNSFSLQNNYGQSILPSNVNCINDTLIEAEFYFTGSDSLGKYNISVPSTNLSPTLLLNQAFTLYSNGASIMNISPDTATIGNGVTITVNSLNSHYLTATNTVLLQSIYGFAPLTGTNILVINDSTLTADFNFTNSNINGKYNLIVTNAVDGTMEIDAAFTLNTSPSGPYILSVNPGMAIFNSPETITINAIGTHFLQGIDSVKLCNLHFNIYPVSMNVVNDTVIIADFLIPSPSYPYFVNGSYLDMAVFGSQSLAYPNAVIVTWPENVTEVHEQNLISVYPNPANDKLTIESLHKSTIILLNLQGKTILQQQIQQGKTDIDISGLAKGIYILRLNSNEKTEVTRIIKE